MANLLTPTFFADCEGIVSLNGHPFISKPFKLADNGKIMSGTTFCETFGISLRMLKDPKSWIGVWVQLEDYVLPVSVLSSTATYFEIQACSANAATVARIIVAEASQYENGKVTFILTEI